METNNFDHVTEWIKEHKRLLYMLGYPFLEDETMIERAINQTAVGYKVSEQFDHEEFKLRFVKECLAISVSKSIRKANDILCTPYFQCLYFKYVLHMETREISSYLAIPEKNVEENLILGFEAFVDKDLLRNCQISVSKLLHYHEGFLNFAEYKEINKFLAEDDKCSQLLEKIIITIDEFHHLKSTLIPSPYFLEGNRPLTEAQMKRKTIRQRIFTTIASLCLLTVIIISSIGIEEMKHRWKLWMSDQVAYGENVYVHAIDQNVEITVTQVAADDTQTIIYYEIRDLEDEYHYNTDLYNDMFEIIEKDIWEGRYLDFYGTSRSMSRFLDEEGVSQGRLFLPPLKDDQDTVTVRFHKIEQLNKGIDRYGNYDPRDRKLINGEWILEIPVTKYEAVTFEIDQTKEVMGQNIYLSHLEVTPTGTFLAYRIEQVSKAGTFEYHDIQFTIKANDKEYFPDYHLERGFYNRGNNGDHIFPFESFYYQQPSELEIILERMHSNYDSMLEVVIDYNSLPMDFEFLNQIITVEEVVIANPVVIRLTEQFDENRSYDHFHINVHYENNHNISYGMSSDGVWIDGDGNQYKSYEELRGIDHPYSLRYISTEQTIELHYHNIEWDDSMLPEKIIIQGYSKSHSLNERIIINLNEQKRLKLRN
ncbi:DUF4179 domain-containing protein [Anaerobacillus isosaccharinicus]|uniref:DUF4179 domain-containing protein n=1 Tax=Anaerobacillus isosaccharinicus TaxID=1532552 RepID=A0A7S7L797_9BACI|nr:DUF4179 domain-containing protein [Anaerobacillus isosaccharinicus]MBA5585994.1 DUF4179 domain-containing protein [Anaerobacillus isosaccharinicus]QOY35728.1 DUF4179 domain-containing protein [Anaerobacillus isosaccharinicus]